MLESIKTKPLNMAESWSTIEEFTNFCDKEKERQMNSDTDFIEADFEQAKDLALEKLNLLKEDGWI
ncbi:MAG: nodulation protein E [Proteobacteria bacterium]|nr:nodulation protein E [Pseudomonadota bacterium]